MVLTLKIWNFNAKTALKAERYSLSPRAENAESSNPLYFHFKYSITALSPFNAEEGMGF